MLHTGLIRTILFVWVADSVQVCVVFSDFMVLVVVWVIRDMFTPVLARMPEAMMDGIRNIALTKARDLVVGTSLITEIMRTSIPAYDINAYAKYSRIEMFSLAYIS